MAPDMDVYQEAARQSVLSGHNVFLCGQAGTGKTFLVKQLFNDLVEMGKACVITCTTGIACAQYTRDHRAMTLHR